jgi:hypothetical protein
LKQEFGIIKDTEQWFTADCWAQWSAFNLKRKMPGVILFFLICAAMKMVYCTDQKKS